MRRRRGIMGLNGGAGIPIITATATGNPLTFETDLAKPLKSLVIPFTPIQSGSGDPSPTNVRPISGWTECNITDESTNVFPFFRAKDVTFKNVRFVSDGEGKITLTGTSTGVDYATFYLSKPFTFPDGSQYKVYFNNTQIIDYRGVIEFYNNSTKLDDWTLNTLNRAANYVSLSGKTCTAIRVNISSGITYDLSIQIMVARNNTPNDGYIPYQEPITIPITFTDPTTGDPMTVYGGTLTLNEDGSADVVATQALWVENGTRQPVYAVWNTGSEGELYNRTLFGGLPRSQHDYAGGYAKYFSSDNRKFTSDINSGEWRNKFCFASYRAAGYSFAYSIPKNLTTKAEVAAYFAENPTTVVYPLNTPITYHFDNVGQLITFVGTNTIWTDTNGTNTATYLKHQS